MRRLLLLSFLMFFSAALAHAECKPNDTLCDALHKIMAARADNFATLRGDPLPQPNGPKEWTGTLLLPWAEDCAVIDASPANGGTPARPVHYACHYRAVTSKEDSQKGYEWLIRRVQTSLPDWTTQESDTPGSKFPSKDTHFLPPDSSPSPVRVNLTQVGDFYMLTLFVDGGKK